jgi:hypothetical protein
MDLNCRVTGSLADVLLAAPINIEKYEALYKHFHEYPELSNLEAKTAKRLQPNYRVSRLSTSLPTLAAMASSAC